MAEQRLIDANALYSKLGKIETWLYGRSDCCTLESKLMVELDQVEALIDNAPTVEERPKDEWISVENKKPYRRADYLCIYQFGDNAEYRYCGVLMFHPEEDAENGYIKGPHFSNEGVNDMRVVYWMPLPKFPAVDMRGEGE